MSPELNTGKTEFLDFQGRELWTRHEVCLSLEVGPEGVLSAGVIPSYSLLLMVNMAVQQDLDCHGRLALEPVRRVEITLPEGGRHTLTVGNGSPWAAVQSGIKGRKQRGHTHVSLCLTTDTT